ncbi:hypothetical protein [Exercitatus varius]|uniref:Uncharacterized protein n=1 Tax=Exercitatus varius TaxID=67857 RepID=A0AAW6QA52_9PAST|nr:hypothetical protein [Exercitatus varius]MDG2941101.1 hypothetical protein [Exercitatus varius]MDG2949182.1 hypothetical protein [Exercitatus varius]
MSKNILWLLAVVATLPVYADTTAAESAGKNPNVSKQDIIGEWQCKIIYDDLQIQALDSLDFQADGSTVGTGLLFVHNNFAYESKHTGRWQLKDNVLSETSTDYSFGRIHPSQTEKRLDEEPKLKEFESLFFENLKENSNSGESVNLHILRYDKNQMIIDHVWDNQKRYPGLCRRKVQEW